MRTDRRPAKNRPSMKGDTSDVKGAIYSDGIAPRCATVNLAITVLNVLQSAA